MIVEMGLSRETQSRKWYYRLLLILIILGGLARAGLWGYKWYLEKQSLALDTQISSKNSEIQKILEDKTFQQYLQVQSLESQKTQIPWSQYIHKILEILESIKSVESGRGGVELSDFKVDLNELSLNGVVSNLRILYGNRQWSWGLIDSFNQLDFLTDISIKNYEKAEEGQRSFKFTLSAKVQTNATTGSTAH